MESLKIAIVAYGFTIVFALFIACLIRVLGWAVKRMRLDRGDEPVDLAVPTADSMKEEESIAVAIAVAHAHRK